MILFIDKTHPPNVLDRTLQSLREFTPRNIEIKVACLIPEFKR